MRLPSVVSDPIAALEPPSWMTELAAHGWLLPVAASTAPMPIVDVLASVVNCPPTTTFEPPGATTSALTVELAPGFQVVSAPEEVYAARRVRVLPFAEVKLPPAYTVLFVADSAYTTLFRLALNDETTAPVAVSNATRRLWVTPSTVVNVPPT